MKKIAVIIYGPPGSGKSTQADLVSTNYDLVRFDTGKYIAAEIYDPKNKNNKTVIRQRMLYEKGLLCDRSWVYKLVTSHLNRIIGAGYGVVLSGSPRDPYEAFDVPGRKGVYSILKAGYGRENIFTFVLKVDPESSVHRNQKRKLCSICKRAYLGNQKRPLEHCPFCGAQLISRKDDKPHIILDRLTEYRKQTEPIFQGLRRIGYHVHEVDGEAAPFKVYAQIKKYLP